MGEWSDGGVWPVKLRFDRSNSGLTGQTPVLPVKLRFDRSSTRERASGARVCRLDSRSLWPGGEPVVGGDAGMRARFRLGGRKRSFLFLLSQPLLQRRWRCWRGLSSESAAPFFDYQAVSTPRPAQVAMLACARIGAVHSVVFGGFGADALAGRLADSRSRVLLTADGAAPRASPRTVKLQSITISSINHRRHD